MQNHASDNGKWEEFNDEEVEAFRELTADADLTTSTPGMPRHANKAVACQVGSTRDEEPQQWMACRDLVRHPDLNMRAHWIDAGGVNEFGRLAQGCKDAGGTIKGMDVVSFILHAEIPRGQNATHARQVVDC